MEFEVELPKEKNTVWDDYVPIVINGHTVDIYLTSYIDTANNYDKMIATLRSAPSYYQVNLHINNGGGYVDSAFSIIDAIKNTKARTTAYISGTVASSATIITLACDEIVCSDYLSFMIHNYSTGMQGKGHEVKAQQEFNDRELNRAFREIYRGFLTEEEMTEVIDGKDKWFNEHEVMERWNRAKEL